MKREEAVEVIEKLKKGENAKKIAAETGKELFEVSLLEEAHNGLIENNVDGKMRKDNVKPYGIYLFATGIEMKTISELLGVNIALVHSWCSLYYLPTWAKTVQEKEKGYVEKLKERVRKQPLSLKTGSGCRIYGNVNFWAVQKSKKKQLQKKEIMEKDWEELFSSRVNIEAIENAEIRMAVDMHYKKDKTWKEIAEKMNELQPEKRKKWNEGSIRMRVHRYLKKNVRISQ